MVSKKTVKSPRIILFDLLKIALIFLVVNIHIRVITPSNAHLFGSLWSYTVPIFMTLSFFFMNKYFSQMKLSFSIVLARIKRLFIPLVFWSAIGFLFNPKLFSIKNAFLQILTGKVVNTPLYYLDILILFSLIYWLITYLPQKIRTPLHFAIIIAALTLDYSGISFRFFDPMIDQVKRSYGQIVELIKYASLGILFATLNKQNKKTIFLLCLTVVSFFLMTYYKFPNTHGFNYSGANLFVGTIFTLSFSLLIGNFSLPSKIGQFVNTLGAYSFGVYLFHIIFLEKLVKIFPNIKTFNNNFPLLFLFLFTVGCYGFCFLFDHFTGRKFSYLIK